MYYKLDSTRQRKRKNGRLLRVKEKSTGIVFYLQHVLLGTTVPGVVKICAIKNMWI